MNIHLADLALLVGGKIMSGDPSLIVLGFASLKEARSGDLSFFHDVRYGEQLANSQATAVLVPVGWTGFPAGVACLAVDDPSRSFEQVVETYGFQPAAFAPGVHATAVIGETVQMDRSRVSIGAHAVIEDERGLPTGWKWERAASWGGRRLWGRGPSFSPGRLCMPSASWVNG